MSELNKVMGLFCEYYYHAEEVDAVIAEKDKEIRRLKRALWIARADRAMMTLDYFTLKCRWFKDYMKVEPPKCDVKMIHKWATAQRKCRAKAKEYK
jgi:hypothetical protein